MVGKASPIPLYCQIKAQLEGTIDSGELPPGARMPSELELAARYQVSRTTARQALQKLCEDGLVTRIQGKGTFVRQFTSAGEAAGISGDGSSARGEAAAVAGAVETTSAALRSRRAVRLVSYRDGDDIAFDRTHQSLVRGIEREARETGYDVILSSCQDCQDDLAELVERRCESGLILYGEFGHAVVSEITRRGVAAVVVDDPDVNGFVDGIRLDHRREAQLATENLLKLGHEDIAYVGGSRMLRRGEVFEWSASQERREGFLATMRAAGHKVYQEHVLVEFGTQRHAYRAARRIFDRIHKPTAIICFSPAIALGMEAAATEMDIRVPEELSLIAFSDTEQVFYKGDRTFTAVWSDAFEMGRQAVRLLRARIAQPARAPQTINVPTELWTGNSCAPVRKSQTGLKSLRTSHT